MSKHFDRARIFNIVDLDGMEAIEATFTKHHFRPHFHDTYLIGITESGVESFSSRGGTHISTALSLRFHNSGEVHSGGPAEGQHWTYRCLYPTGSLLREIAQDISGSQNSDVFFPTLVQADPAPATELLRAFDSLRSPASSLERGTRFRIALSRIVLRYGGSRPSLSPPRRDPRTVLRAQAFISDQASHDFTLSELAKAVGLSPFHLLRTFKQQIGLTPFAYQAQRRVELARAMLASGSGIDATARRSGFYDRSHMTRNFLAILGTTPGAFRSASR